MAGDLTTLGVCSCSCACCSVASLENEKNINNVDKSAAALTDAAEVLKLAAPLSKEQLIEILTEACASSPAVSRLLYRASVASPASRRLMVRNIHYSTTDEKYIEHFRRFGQLDDAAIVRERSGRSKGFGFVTFSDIRAMNACLESPLHLDGRKLFVKVAADPFSEFVVDGMPVQGRCTRRKIFVRNLGPICDADILKNYFTKYGKVDDCSVVYSSAGVSKGFAFVTFQKQDSAVRAAAEPQQTLSGRVIFVSMAKSSALPLIKPSLSNIPRQDTSWQATAAPPNASPYIYDLADLAACDGCSGDNNASPTVFSSLYKTAKLPLAKSTTSSASDRIGCPDDASSSFNDLIDSCLNSFKQADAGNCQIMSSTASSLQFVPDLQLSSWQASTNWSAGGDDCLPKRFVDYACGLKDAVF